MLAAAAGCERQAPPVSQDDGRLVVAVRPGPTSWFPGPDGVPTGFDHDLLTRFADERKLTLTVIEVDSAEALLAKVAAGEAHVGVGGLYPPPPSTRKADDARPDPRPVLWTNGYYAVEPVLIFGTGTFKPKSWSDLKGAEVGYVDATGIDAQLRSVRAAHPEVVWKPQSLASADALIAQVDAGDLDYAVVSTIDAATARNIFLDFDVAFTVGPKRDLAWAVAPARRSLRDEIDRFFTRARKEGLLARYADRYFSHAAQVERIDAGVFQDRLRAVLPSYRRMFEDAQIETGVEWRLLAALAYQESQWDPFATSDTGVRGFMQITEDTARKLGVADRLDPRASTLGAARYIALLKNKLPARISRARPHVAGARRLQHRTGPPRGRAHPRAAAEAQSGPVGGREEGAAAARLAGALQHAQERLRARRHAGRVRRSRARVLRHRRAGREAAAAAPARDAAAGDPMTARKGCTWGRA